MTLIPYEITFLLSPRARQREAWIRFASSIVDALDGAQKAAKEEHLQADGWTCEQAGQDAEGRVSGVVRGGRVFRGKFYFHGPGPRAVRIEDVRELRIY